MTEQQSQQQNSEQAQNETDKETHQSKDKSVDQSWKEAVQQEKEQLKEKQQQNEEAKEVYPEASFQSIVGSFGMQVAVALGQVENPVTGETSKDLDQAKHFIDSLRVLRDKTEGNLTDQEEQHLNALIKELQMQYVNEMKGGSEESTQQQSSSSEETELHTP